MNYISYLMVVFDCAHELTIAVLCGHFRGGGKKRRTRIHLREQIDETKWELAALCVVALATGVM